MSDTPTGPWVQPMIRAKATDPRNGLPSWNRLGELAGLSTSTVTAMISGSRKTSTATIQKIATVLNVDAKTISGWLELNRPVRDKYTPPPEADLLTERQRKALTNLIRSIVADEQEEGTDSGTSAQKSPQPGTGGLQVVPDLEVSEPDESVEPAADRVNPDADEEPGGSDSNA